ncbi:hypothetical protein BDW59DRAFT_160962 [Aspergillus cavernicola]|uniref:Uncharacterized protein n=1 Tax=Aspergillus cavernicola TaxID=176166 RepID=A0ABR4IFQ1_9EURO
MIDNGADAGPSGQGNNKGKNPMRDLSDDKPDHYYADPKNYGYEAAMSFGRQESENEEGGYSPEFPDSYREMSSGMSNNAGSPYIRLPLDDYPRHRSGSEGETWTRGFSDRVETLLRDPTSTMDQKMQWISGELNERGKALNDHQDILYQLEHENMRLKDEIEALGDKNEELFQDHERSDRTIRELKETVEFIQTSRANAHSTSDVGEVHLAQLKMLQEAREGERAAKAQLDSHNIQMSQMQEQLTRGNLIINHFRQKQHELEKNTSKWAANLKDLTVHLSMENGALRNRVGQMTSFINTNRASDINRWLQNRQTILQPGAMQQQQAPRLVYGTLDRDMSDADDPDVHMTTRPDKHISSSLIRLRRRLAHPKSRPKHIGSRRETAEKQTARPTEFKRGSVKTCAANSYLQVRNGRDKTAPKPVKGRSDGVSQLLTSRKRSRLNKAGEMVKRVQALGDAGKLPPPPKRLSPWYSPNPYDRRNDAELSRLMAGFSMEEKEEPSEAQKEATIEAKIVTVLERVEHFIPRSRIFSAPRYLPKEPTSLSSKERRAWANLAKNWALGPDMGNRKGKKQVRFAKDLVEYEPEQSRTEYPKRLSTKGSGWSMSWSHLIIVILMILLFVSNMGGSNNPKESWGSVNKRPDIAALLRSPHHSGGEIRPKTVIGFEIGRWSDVDPSVVG